MEATAIAGMVSPMLAIAEPKARLRLVCKRSRRAARVAASVSGSNTSRAITTPTKDGGNPIAATPASMAGDSTLANPTTATSAANKRPTLANAARRVGGSACSSAPATSPAEVTGRKKSRCRTVWVSTNRPYRMTDASAAKVSCAGENSGPGRLVVKVGRTRLSVASVAMVASAAPVPSALNEITEYRSPPTKSERPTMPLQVIITAAKTVSRASELVSGPPDTINVTINATSMTVTATARTSDPNGSPTRWATISAWVTADKTAAPRTTATTTTTVPGFRPQVSASTSRAINGESSAQESRGARAVAVVMVAPTVPSGRGRETSASVESGSFASQPGGTRGPRRRVAGIPPADPAGAGLRRSGGPRPGAHCYRVHRGRPE